jgi:hypothetical protein
MLYVYYHIGSQHVRYGDYKKQNTDFCTLKSQMLKIFLSLKIYPRNEACLCFKGLCRGNPHHETHRIGKGEAVWRHAVGTCIVVDM